VAQAPKESLAVPPTEPTGPHWETGLQFERFVFFSDAVFAIAITLLVLELRLPPGSGGHVDLGELWPKLFGFLLSFFVIGAYWLNHHRLFGVIKAEDSLLRTVNLIFLASIVFLPFPTSVIAENRPSSSAVCFYAASVALVGFLMSLLVLVARRQRFLAPGDGRGQTVHFVIYTLSAPLIFAISAVVALSQPVLAMRMWWLVALATPLADLLGGWIERRMQAAPSHSELQVEG